MARYSSEPNVTAVDSLQTRLEVNAKYSSFDFHAWVFSRLALASGMDVLDVGCGTGVQAVKAIKAVGQRGSVSALDLSPESVAVLEKTVGAVPNIQTRVADMKDLGDVIAKELRVKRYDLAYSVYALWYSSDHYGTLDAMRQALKRGGRLVVCTPNAPNGLRETIKSLGYPRPELEQVTTFGAHVLEPYFRTYFDEVTIHMRRNLIKITKADDALRFYSSTGYYDATIAEKLKRHAQANIEENGFFGFEKNVYLIEGIARS